MIRSHTVTSLGADDAGESNLTYTWTVLVKPAGAGDPAFSVEGKEGDGSGTHAARTTTATFTALGNCANRGSPGSGRAKGSG
ncbi:MAG: hypothetical protein RBS80_31600 [Thermoguttaceae bacterium]|nr:hypothetical protein [Thermoguttaceae bacterium]